MAAWRLDGKPRTARRFSVYQHCPLAPPDARLFFLLTSRKPSTLQVVQGRRFGMRQRKAKPWSHVLLPALLAAYALFTIWRAPSGRSRRLGTGSRA